MESTQSNPTSAFSWLAIPRAVWVGAAAFGIAAVSAGAAIWLQPARPAQEAANQPVAAAPALASNTHDTPAPIAKLPKTVAQAPVAQAPAAAPAPCATCGVVESVQAFKKKGEGTGVGAVAGGVLGGAVGNQMGHGNGRAAMTVLGAVGGGLAGHEVEKRVRSETLYNVHVRMDDGSMRTVTRAQPLAVGTAVTVQGQTLRLAHSAEGGAGG